MGKSLLVTCCLVVFLSVPAIYAQNTGLGTDSPTHTLHVVPAPNNAERDPLRIDSLQYYQTLSDTTVLVTDPVSGVIRYMPVRLIGVGGENWIYDSVEGYLIGKQALNTGNILVVSDSGRIGIGSTTPSHPLHIKANHDPIRLEGLQEKVDQTHSALVTGADGVLYTTPLDSIMSVEQWSSGNLQGSSGIYATQSAENGDTVMVTESGRLLLGSMSFEDELKALHLLATYTGNLSSDQEKQTEIATEYKDKLSGTILKADGGIELYRTKDIHAPNVTGYIDFHSKRETDYDVRLHADTTHRLLLGKGTFDQRLYISENLNPSEDYVGGYHLLQTNTLDASFNKLTGVQGLSFRNGSGYTNLLQGGSFQSREQADHDGELNFLRGLEAGVLKYGSGENTGSAHGILAYVNAQEGATGRLRYPIGTHTGVTLLDGSEVEIEGNLRSINAYVNIDASDNGKTIPLIMGIQANLNSTQEDGTHQEVTNAEVIRLGHNGNFAAQESLYGLRITSITGGITNNYAIYTDSGKVRFGDVIQQAGSFAEDNYAISLGSADTVLADRAMAIGYKNFIGKEARESFVLGRENILSDEAGASNMIMGERNSIGEGSMSVVGGWQSYINGDRSFAFGDNDSISGNRSVAFGFQNVINGSNAAAFGYKNTVGEEGMAFGSENIINAPEGAFASGSTNRVSDHGGFAAGKENVVDGEYWNAAFGHQNSIGGSATRSSLIGGNQNYISSSYSLVVGEEDTLTADASAVFGKHNIVDGTTSLVAGADNFLNGTGPNSSNLLVGTDNVLGDGIGAVWESAILGKGNLLIGARSFIMGEADTLEADYGTILGLRSRVTGTRGMALGTEVAASADQLVMGFQNGVFLKDGNASISTAPTGYSGLISDAGELYALDANGNKTGISPHNFSLIPQGPSEKLAWAYYSELNGQAINVDMARVIRLVEQLSGEQLIYQKGVDEAVMDIPQQNNPNNSMQEEISTLKAENEHLRKQLNTVATMLQKLQEQVDRMEKP